MQVTEAPRPTVHREPLAMPAQNHLTEAELRALGARLARYGRRRRAAERGEDWTIVR